MSSHAPSNDSKLKKSLTPSKLPIRASPQPLKQTYLPPKQIQKPLKQVDKVVPKPEQALKKEDFYDKNELTTVYTSSEVSNDENDSSAYESDDNTRFYVNTNGQSKVFKELEDRARTLIDKTDFLLTEQFAVSSDGIGSISSSRSSQATANTLSTLPYKPDFVKYLELNDRQNHHLDVNKHGTNDDILTQWRLRRKFDQAKNTQISHKYNHLMTKCLITESTPALVTPQLLSSQMPITQHEIIPKKHHESQTISTQTNVDMAVQTSIDSAIKETSKLIDEEPTRDENIKRKRPEEIHGSNARFVFKQKSTPKVSQDQQSIVSDLTKVSSILDNTRPTNHPHQHQHNSLQKSNASNMNSSMNSIIGDLNNDTKNEKKKNEETHQEVALNVDLPHKNEDSDYLESDEILSILFKKSFYYQSKLNQIEKLIALAQNKKILI